MGLTFQSTTTGTGADLVATDETERLIASKMAEGTAVNNRKGERLVEVCNVMVDKYSGQVAYAVLSLGGFLEIGLSTIGRNALNCASGSRVFARQPATPATGKERLANPDPKVSGLSGFGPPACRRQDLRTAAAGPQDRLPFWYGWKLANSMA